MSDPVARSWRVTRRSLAATALGVAGAVALAVWPRGRSGEGLDGLAGRADAADLRAIGARLQVSAPMERGELERRLSAKLASGYEAALANDRRAGALIAVDGWMIPETQALAGLWLASA